MQYGWYVLNTSSFVYKVQGHATDYSSELLFGYDANISGGTVRLRSYAASRAKNTGSKRWNFDTVDSIKYFYRGWGISGGYAEGTALSQGGRWYIPITSPGGVTSPVGNITGSNSEISSRTTSMSCNYRIIYNSDYNSRGFYATGHGNIRPYTYGSSVSYSAGLPSFSISVASRTPSSISVSLYMSDTWYSCWGVRFQLNGSWYGGVMTEGTITFSGLTPGTNYNITGVAVWRGSTGFTGNSQALSVATLNNPPHISGISLLSRTHYSASFRVTLKSPAGGTLSYGLWNYNSGSTGLPASNSYYTRDISISGLSANSSYTLYTRIIDQYGQSTSYNFGFTTLPSPPSINSVTFSDITYKAARLIADISVYTGVKSCIVQYRRSGTSAWTTVASGASRITTAYLDGLTPATTYEVNWYINDQYDRSSSLTRSFKTKDNPPEVAGLTIKDLSYYRTDLEIKYRVETGINSFTAQLKRDGKVIKTNSINAKGTSNREYGYVTTSFENLDPFSNYSITVAITDSYVITDSESVSFKTLEDKAVVLVYPDGSTFKGFVSLVYLDNSGVTHVDPIYPELLGLIK